MRHPEATTRSQVQFTPKALGCDSQDEYQKLSSDEKRARMRRAFTEWSRRGFVWSEATEIPLIVEAHDEST
jgi:hypothetical protein